jgi:hypothetical protein
LTAFIKAQLNNQATDVAVGEVLAQLKQGGMLTLPDGKVTYPPAYPEATPRLSATLSLAV